MDLCKPLYEERGKSVARRLDDEIERIHKEGGDEKEEEGSKRDDDGGDDGAGGGEEREGAASMEDASDDDDIYGNIASIQVDTNTNTKDDAKDYDGEEGSMVVTPQFWVCAMGHMDAIAKLITERA